MIALVILLVVAVAAIGVVALKPKSVSPVSAPQPSIPTPNLAPSPNPVSTPSLAPTPPLSEPPATTPPLIPQEDVDEEVDEPETEPEENTSSNNESKPESTSTEANNAIEDGIHDAYFAKEIYDDKSDELAENVKGETIEKSYTIQRPFSVDNTSEQDAITTKIATAINSSIASENIYVKDSTIRAKLPIDPNTKHENSLSFQAHKLLPTLHKISSASLSEDIIVVAKSFNLAGKEVTITIQEKEELLVAADAPLSVIETKENNDDAKELTELKATFDDDGLAKIKIKLRPKLDDDLKIWEEKLADGTKNGNHNYTVNNEFTVTNDLDTIATNITNNSNKALAPDHTVKKEDVSKLLTEGQTYPAKTIFEIAKYTTEKKTELLWLKASCDGDEQCHQGEFLKEEGKYFKIGNSCSCNRNLTTDEIKRIINDLRKDEGLPEDVLFDKPNHNLPQADRTFERFTEEINKAFNTYDITTCARKTYFIAETYHESDRYRTTKEYDSAHTPRYDPLRGRGLIQLTKTDSYRGYSNYRGIDFVANYEDIANNLFNAIDASGWFWKKGKVLNKGTEWRGYPRTRITGDHPYTTIDLNLLADKNDADNLTYLINGGDNGLKERRKYLALLKQMPIFKCSTATSEWHDPVDDPMLCLYTQNGNYRPRYNVFGKVRTERSSANHQGVDLLALPGSSAYACLEGTVVRSENVGSGYGNVVTIKVKDPELLKSRKRAFTLQYQSEGELANGPSFNENGDLYLFYAHLQTRSVNLGDPVDAGEVIGLNGTSGYGQTKDPHLHFEILNAPRAAGLNNRTHPGQYFYYKGENDLTQAEKDKQKEIAEKFWD